MQEQLPLFACLPPNDHARLVEACQVRKLCAQEQVFAIGDRIHHVFFVLAGTVARATVLSGGVEKVFEFLRPGRFCALSEVFSTDTYASFARAAEPSTVVVIDADLLRTMVSRHAALGEYFLHAMAEHQFATEFEAPAHHSVSVTQRVLDYLVRLAGDRHGPAGETTVELDGSKKLVASRLDMAPETFSRTLRQLADTGVIFVDKRSIHLQNATIRFNEEYRNSGTRQRPATAAGPRTLPSDAQLINLAGRQRMLSQRLATKWCLQVIAIGTRAAEVSGRKYRDQFEQNLQRLSLAIQDGETRTYLLALKRRWSIYCNALFGLVPSACRADAVFDLSEQVLQLADDLTCAAERTLISPMGKWVNIAGRNRMLAARMIKMSLFRSLDVRQAEIGSLDRASRQEFIDNLALLRGMQGNTRELLAQLTIDEMEWLRFVALVDRPAEPGKSTGTIPTLLAANSRLLRHLDTTVRLYEQLADRSQST